MITVEKIKEYQHLYSVGIVEAKKMLDIEELLEEIEVAVTIEEIKPALVFLLSHVYAFNAGEFK